MTEFQERWLALFQHRLEQLADQVRAKKIGFLDAVDLARDAAIHSGLLDAIGEDAIQSLLAAVFMNLPRGNHHDSHPR